MSVTALELAALRADLAGMAMPDTCTIERDAGGAPDPWGGAAAPVYAAHLVGVPCAYWQASESTERDERDVTIARQRVSVPHGTDVRETDRVVDVRDAGGVLRTASALRIDAVAKREAVVELEVTEVSWEGA